MWIGVEYKISPLSQRSRRVRWLHPPPQPEIFGIKFKGSENVADINLQMTQRNAGNTAWDNLNPITIVENVRGAAKQADLTAHLADVASQVVGKGADMIALPDPNNHFTSTNVRGAMDELFTNVDSGKIMFTPLLSARELRQQAKTLLI